MKVIDKIRSMSEEELAEVIYDMDALSPETFGDRFEKFCESRSRKNEDGYSVCISMRDCKGCIREWLNSEYED